MENNLNSQQGAQSATLLNALNRFVSQVQRSTRTENEVCQLFTEQISQAGLTGSISQLSDDGKYLAVKALAIAGGGVSVIEDMSGNQAIGLPIPLAASQTYQQVLNQAYPYERHQ
jgi:hypothetical protein